MIDELFELKKQALLILENQNVKPHIINLIKSAKDISKLRKILTYRLDIKYKQMFENEGINYHYKQNTKIKSSNGNFKEFKNQVLKILNQYPIKYYILKRIQKTTTYNNLRDIIINEIDIEYRQKLDEAGVEYNSNSDNFSFQEVKKFNDETKHSVKVIYTPMGNKR